MITGANAGIGFVTAQSLLAAGAEVVISTRSATKTRATIDRLCESLPLNASISVKGVSMDLSSMSSIEAGVKEFIGLGVMRLDALCLNAGVMAIPEYTETNDGLEMQWGVNHVGHFYLFKLLESTILKLPGHTRIVVLASMKHFETPNDFAVDTHLPPNHENYDMNTNYCISKLSNIYMARELARRFEGKGVTAYSVHPGIITGTSLWRHLPSCLPCMLKCFFYAHCSCLWFPDFKSVRKGASTQLYLMTCPLAELSNGGYYVGCRLQNSKSRLYKYTMVENEEEAEKLWVLSEKIIADRKIPL